MTTATWAQISASQVSFWQFLSFPYLRRKVRNHCSGAVITNVWPHQNHAVYYNGTEEDGWWISVFKWHILTAEETGVTVTNHLIEGNFPQRASWSRGHFNSWQTATTTADYVWAANHSEKEQKHSGSRQIKCSLSNVRVGFFTMWCFPTWKNVIQHGGLLQSLTKEWEEKTKKVWGVTYMTLTSHLSKAFILTQLWQKKLWERYPKATFERHTALWVWWGDPALCTETTETKRWSSLILWLRLFNLFVYDATTVASYKAPKLYISSLLPYKTISFVNISLWQHYHCTNVFVWGIYSSK